MRERIAGVLFVMFVTLPLSALGQQSSRYEPLLATPAGRDTLQDLALWEDGRVTGEGRLFAYLKSKNPLVRLRAVEIIGRLQDTNDVPHLLPLLQDKDQRVVLETVFALGQIGSTDAVEPLVDLSKHAPPEVVIKVSEALGKIGGDDALSSLTELLRDFHAQVRRSAALALARLQDPRATRALLIALRDMDAGVVWRAVYALRGAPSNRVATTALPLLNHENGWVRAHTASTLSNHMSKDVVDGLIRALGDKNWHVVVNAASALGKIGNDKAVHPLGKIAETHRSHHARRAAVMALKEIGSKKAKDHIIQALIDTSPGVRAAALRAIAHILGTKAGLFLHEGLQDGDRLVRATAVEGIGIAKISERIDFLIERSGEHSDPMMRAAAVRALSHFEFDLVGDALVQRLTDQDWVVATEAVKAINEIEHRGAVQSLLETFKTRTSREEGNLRLEILRALKAFKAIEAVPMLHEALEDPDNRIRSIALEALEELREELPEVKPDRFFYESAFDPSRKRSLSLPMGREQAIIECDHGEIEIELFGDDAIQTVANFIKLAKQEFYDGLTFHRVVPNFVVQGGDPRGDGWGDAGYYIRSEFNQHGYGRGYIGIAHDGKDTGGSQFFITHSPQRRLDGRYTIFGRVTKGMDVVDRIDQGDTFRVRIID